MIKAYRVSDSGQVGAFNRFDVYETISAVLTVDKPVAFFNLKPLHFSFHHFFASFYWGSMYF